MPSKLSWSNTTFALDTLAGVSTRTDPVNLELTNATLRAPFVYSPVIVRPSNRRLFTDPSRVGLIEAATPAGATRVTVEDFAPPENDP